MATDHADWIYFELKLHLYLCHIADISVSTSSSRNSRTDLDFNVDLVKMSTFIIEFTYIDFISKTGSQVVAIIR